MSIKKISHEISVMVKMDRGNLKRLLMLFVSCTLLIVNMGVYSKTKPTSSEMSLEYIKKVNKELESIAGIKLDERHSILSMYFTLLGKELIQNSIIKVDDLSSNYTKESIESGIDSVGACKKIDFSLGFSNVEKLSLYWAYRYSDNKIISVKIICNK